MNLNIFSCLLPETMRIVGQTKCAQKCIVRIIVQGVHFSDTMIGRSLPLLPFVISFNEFLVYHFEN